MRFWVVPAFETEDFNTQCIATHHIEMIMSACRYGHSQPYSWKAIPRSSLCITTELCLAATTAAGWHCCCCSCGSGCCCCFRCCCRRRRRSRRRCFHYSSATYPAVDLCSFEIDENAPIDMEFGYVEAMDADSAIGRHITYKLQSGSGAGQLAYTLHSHISNDIFVLHCDT